LTGINENFDDLWSSYISNRELYYKNSSNSKELVSMYSNLSIEQKKTSIPILKKFTKEESHDFFVSFMLVNGLFSIGKVVDAKNSYIKIADRLVKTKKFHRVKELNEYLNTLKLKEIEKYADIAKCGHGFVQEVGGDRFVLDRISFNDIKLNSSIYFKNTFILKRFVDYIEVYSELEIIESILKAIPVIPIDNHFVKSLEKISYSTGSEVLALSVSNVIENLGQSFGVNIDALKKVKRQSIDVSQNEGTQLEYRAPIDLSHQTIVGTSSGGSKLEHAISAKDNGDHLLAIGLFREIIFEGNINKETYLQSVVGIANCYTKLGNRKRADKLSAFLKRKTVE